MRILAMDIGGTVIKSAVFEDSKEIPQVRETPSPGTEVEACIRSAITIARSYPSFDVLSVAMTGQIDSRTLKRVYEYGKDIDTDEGIPVGEILEAEFQCPVYVLNDSNAAALGEAKYGAGKKYRDFLCLTYGTGVGGGIIQNGKLILGQRGIAAEFGHMVIHGGGRLCKCGHRGCYEAYASTTALVQAGQKLRPEIKNGRQLFDMVEKDREMAQIVDAWIQEIVEGLCTLTYIFNPACIVLGGGVMEREGVLQGVRQKFFEQIIPSFHNMEIVAAQLGNMAGLYGAFIYAKEQC